MIKTGGFDMLFSPAGTVTAAIRVPQIAFAQNPWALVPGLARSASERAKALLQRGAYRRAMLSADTLVFNSRYMRHAYRENAGIRERRSFVVYQGVDDDTFQAAAQLGSVTRQRNLVLAVSEMAPHKGIETLVEALAILRSDRVPDAVLALVGKWPEPAYERRIRRLVAGLSLEGAVEFAGFVSREELHRRYAGARVFSLMSRCESFGIPAVEAQAFGTPVVSSNCCAIPEVCGAGGVFPEPGDAGTAALEIGRLMDDDTWWETLSGRARDNAARFRWNDCSRPFLKAFDSAAPGDEDTAE
jgi:glycosyltransferase involved in cell wall biosynthesis